MEDLTINEVMDQPADVVVQTFKAREAIIDYKKYMSQYDPRGHDIHDENIRPKKVIKKNDTTALQDVTRLSMPFQKIIVDRAAAFLIGNGVNIISDPASGAEQDTVNTIKKIWHDNKCDYKSRQIARTWMSETEVAEFWYIHEDKNKELKPRMQVWARSMGDSLYPYFDEYGDLIAFGRGYKIGNVEFLDVWTAEHVYNYQYVEKTWLLQEKKVNQTGKIPVIYYTREAPEWSDVQPLIDRYEKMISNYSDANDYFASPMVVVKGKVHGFAEKGEQGKMITVEENADVRYLTWDQAPEAIKLEEELLRNGIMSLSQTPDISFREMKGLGSAISGTALEMMFMDAKLKTLKHQEEFGEGIQRRLNLIKAIIRVMDSGTADVHVEPEFVFFMPRNEEELVRMLVTGTGNRAIISQKTAVENSPFTINAERELEEVKADEAGFFGNIVP
jgi:SPP1 family phage portal protein